MREMKNSGIEWIGESPKDWHVSHLKYVCSFKTGETPSNKVGIGSTGDYQWITPSDLGDSFLVETSNQYITHEAVTINHYKLFPTSSILLVCIASVGKVGIIDKQSYANQQITALIPNNIINPKFLMYSMSAASSQIQFDASSNVVPIINIKYLENFSFTYPNIKYQRIISDILDQKCSEIDAITKDIQAQIDTLEQYKRSVIFKSVSKGIRNASLKNTESDVWTEIPTTWTLRDIKFLFEIVKRIAGKEGYDILSVTQKGLKVKDISSNEGQLADNYSGYQFVYPTDYVMNHMDLLTGWVDCSTKFGVTSPDYRVFRLRDKEHNSLSYFKYVMQCCYMCKIFYSLGQGVSTLGRWRLQTSVFNNFKVPVPPYSEQQEIAQYLDQTCSLIDETIEEKHKQIEVLSDYKKSLIYEYITGKKEI